MNDFAQFLIALFWYAVFILLPGGVFSVLIHYLLSLPMRRRDRALFFLDLMETVLQRGQPLEPAILAAAENRDRAIGVRFYLVAAHIEGGARLGEAL
jgi:Flp pilus assembly protein TadB